MPLRPYQEQAIADVRAQIAAGKRRVCIVMPTGAGKTRTAGEIVRLVVGRGKRALWGAQRGELVDQAVAALIEAGLTVGALSASAIASPNPYAPVQVATWQTLIARNLTPPADVIIFDECHHAVAATWAEYIARYPGAYLIGLTATPERSDGRGLGAMFDSLVVGARVKQLVALGHLVPVGDRLIRPASKLKEYQIAQRPVDAYLQHARGSRAIVFCPRVAIAEEAAAQFRALGLRAVHVDGHTPWADRRTAFADLRAGNLDALVNVYVATEGFDVPEIDAVILARGIGTAGGYLQMVGRGLRPAPGKSGLIVIDLTGASHDHGHPEDDREYTLDGKGISSPKDAPIDIYCQCCGCVLEEYPTPEEPCPECGFAPPPPEVKVTGDPLVKYESKRREGPEKRIETLARWIREARAKGWKPKAPHGKFRAVYGQWPPPDIEAAAMALAR